MHIYHISWVCFCCVNHMNSLSSTTKPNNIQCTIHLVSYTNHQTWLKWWVEDWVQNRLVQNRWKLARTWVENTWKMGGIFQLCKMHTYFDHWNILAHASHKDIWNSIFFHALLMNNTPTFFKHNYASTCIQCSHKSNNV